MACLRHGCGDVSLRQRPICRGAAPGYRRRRRDQRADPRPTWWAGLICRLGPGQRSVDHDRDTRRLFGHPRPPRLDRGLARGSHRRRRTRRRDRPLGYGRAHSSLRAHGHSDDLRPEWVPRPVGFPAGTRDRARERALLDAGTAAGADDQDGIAAAPTSRTCRSADDGSRTRAGSGARDSRDCRGGGAANRPTRAHRRRRRVRPSIVVRSRLRRDACHCPAPGRPSVPRRAAAEGDLAEDRVDPNAETGRASRSGRRFVGPDLARGRSAGTAHVGAAEDESRLDPPRGRPPSRRGPAAVLGADCLNCSAGARRRPRPRRSAGLLDSKPGAARDGGCTLPESHAPARTRHPRNSGPGRRRRPAAPTDPTVICLAGGPWGATYHLWRCAST